MPDEKKKPVRMRDLVGTRVVLTQMLDTDLDTGPARVRLQMGTDMKVASTGRGFNLETGPCPHCGVDVYVTDVRRAHVRPEGDPEAPRPAPAAFWTSQEEKNDHLWARCSKCGFMAENYKVVKQGLSSDDYTGVRWPFCPMCGSRMGFRGIFQKKVISAAATAAAAAQPEGRSDDEPR